MKNEWVLITGSSRGLGRHLAIEFTKAGYDIILHASKESKQFNKTFKEIRKHNLKCKKASADFSNKSGLDKIVRLINDLKPAILINNAALYKDKDTFKQINVSLAAPIVLINTACKMMAEKGGGTIININSMAGQLPNYNEAVYCALKFGLRGFSESIKYEMLKNNVRIIDLYPGAINTGMSSHKKDRNDLIDPAEFSKFILKIIETKSFIAHNISFTRTK